MANYPLMRIPQPELLLPDDQLSKADQYEAVSTLWGGTFTSLATMLKARKAIEYDLNGRMTDVQRAIAGPTFVMYRATQTVNGPDGEEKVAIETYGYIPDPGTAVEMLDKERNNEIDDKMGRRLRRRIENANQRGWLYGQWFRVGDTRGAWGCMHRSMIAAVLDEATFAKVQANGWRSEA